MKLFGKLKELHALHRYPLQKNSKSN